MVDIIRFDFDGFDQDRVGVHPEHGAVVQATPFISWLGFGNPRQALKDNLREGDFIKGVSFRTPSGRQRGTILTKRGVRRLLFRSNHPRAVQYADLVLDMLDELDATGIVVNEKGITDDQIEEGRRRLAKIAQGRIEERSDYRAILHSLKLGQAVPDDYGLVQNTLYVGLFGMTAGQIRASQPQVTGKQKVRGTGLVKSTSAKDYLRPDQIAILNSTVLATIAQIQLYHPSGANAAQMIAAINAAVSIIRRPIGA